MPDRHQLMAEQSLARDVWNVHLKLTCRHEFAFVCCVADFYVNFTSVVALSRDTFTMSIISFVKQILVGDLVTVRPLDDPQAPCFCNPSREMRPTSHEHADWILPGSSTALLGALHNDSFVVHMRHYGIFRLFPAGDRSRGAWRI